MSFLTEQTAFPAIMVVMQLGASYFYWADGDWRKMVYWLAATTLTVVVTW